MQELALEQAYSAPLSLGQSLVKHLSPLSVGELVVESSCLQAEEGSLGQA